MSEPTLHQAFAVLGYYSLGRAAVPGVRCHQYSRPVFRGRRLVRPMTAPQGWAFLAKVERKLAALRSSKAVS